MREAGVDGGEVAGVGEGERGGGGGRGGCLWWTLYVGNTCVWVARLFR